MKKIIIFVIIICLSWPLFSQAATLPSSYPRLANYFLPWEISDSEAEELAKWDLLILDMEVAENSPDQLKKIRKLNPQVIILAYLTSQEIISNIDDYDEAYLRQELYSGIYSGWWLKDGNGNRISNWPETNMLNLTDSAPLDSQGRRFNDYLPEFVAKNIQATGLWDGVFYDNTWGDVSWINNGNIDLDGNGQPESASEIDRQWAAGFKKMLAQTRSLTGSEFVIIGNGRVYDGYQGIINGMMLESFPSSWENGGTWAGSMKTYLKLPTINHQPSLPVINIYDKNQANYQHVRYGLTSALMGDGFFSYDYDVTNHGQTWWYDEYDFELGSARSQPYNLLAGAGKNDMKAGLWRRDFQNGLAIVNSTDSSQTYVFSKEDVSRFLGSQDHVVNSGERINYLRLEPRDGIILSKKATTLNNSSFVNGYFYRVFNDNGVQKRAGFFSFLSAFPGGASIFSIMAADQAGDQVVASAGRITIYRAGQKIHSFKPYDNLFAGDLNLAAQSDQNTFSRLVVGPGVGGGPQVRIFSGDGQKLQGSWFAYDKNLRGGVNVAIGDVDGDGEDEIVTGPGKGSEPLVKIFSLKGKEESSFLAYDRKFSGGVNVAVGNLNNDDWSEIITSPASAGGPQIRIFDSYGHSLGSFFAYNQTWRGGLEISISDIDNDGRVELLTGLKNFY